MDLEVNDRPVPPNGYEIIESGEIRDDDFVWDSDGFWQRFDGLDEGFRKAMKSTRVEDFYFVARKKQ